MKNLLKTLLLIFIFGSIGFWYIALGITFIGAMNLLKMTIYILLIAFVIAKIIEDTSEEAED